jgi:prolyl-tRNA synthetase
MTSSHNNLPKIQEKFYISYILIKSRQSIKLPKNSKYIIARESMSNHTIPPKQNNISEWYNTVIERAGLSCQAPVRGCIVMRPYGQALWEHIQKDLDARIKHAGYENCAFPLLIPQSFLQKEKEHVEGFAPEVAVVTHAGGEELQEPLIIRPTSETMIHYMFAQWIHSWRDLPLKVNQWCSVIRWEMRPRAFLRTTEFWWHEAHAAHLSYQSAYDDMVHAHYKIYKDFVENTLAIPLFSGEKPSHERFAGAEITLTHEAIMPDGKALQMCTSHLLSQDFARSFAIEYQDQDGTLKHPYLISWGASTRLIGALILTHGDDAGLILPPKIAPVQVVIIPIIKKDTKDTVIDFANSIKTILEAANIRVKMDADDTTTPGNKFFNWELKGVPLRIEIGLREAEQEKITCVSRIDKNKTVYNSQDKALLVQHIEQELACIQQELYTRAQENLKQRIAWAKNIQECIQNSLENKASLTHWCDTETCIPALKEHGMTVRCKIDGEPLGECCVCRKAQVPVYLVAKAY